MVAWCRRVADSQKFQNAVLVVIVIAAVVVGLETSAPLQHRFRGTFHALDLVIQAVFVTELTIRLVAFWPRLPAFFRDGWNVFDFAIVAASFLPSSGTFATVGRLARLLRASRLLGRVPELRLIIGTTLRSIKSMGHVMMLLGLLVYIYAVLGFHLFGPIDPAHWGDLWSSVLTLMGVLTLEGWVDVQSRVIDTNPWAWAFFLSFILMAVFVGLNLFIAIVINNLEATKEHILAEERRVARESGEIPAAGVLVEEIREKLTALEARIAA